MKNFISAKLLFSILMLLPLSSSAFVISFEDGLSYGLGHGPVPVQPYDFGGYVVNFYNATYADSYSRNIDGTYSCNGPPCATSGRVWIGPYKELVPFYGYQPITIVFDFFAESVSVWAVSPLGLVPSTLTAYDEHGQEIGSDGYWVGPPSDPTAHSPYVVELSVTASDIKSIELSGQFFSGLGSGWTTNFDDLSVTPMPNDITPVPEPFTIILLLPGLVLMGVVARWKR